MCLYSHHLALREIQYSNPFPSGGEPAAAVIVDATARLIPQVLGNFESALEDSYVNQMLGAPCYTRPAEYRGLRPPDVLLSGDHSAVKEYRRKAAIRKCLNNRPELLDNAELTEEEVRYIEELKQKKKND